MRLCRFDDDRYGIVGAGMVRDVTEAVARATGTFQLPLPAFDPVIAGLEKMKPALLAAAANAEPRPVDSVRLLSPVGRPGKVVAAPVNYLRHLDEVRAQRDLHHGVQIKEIQNIGLFLKAPSSIIGVSDTVNLRFPDRRNDHEVELAAIIGKEADRVSAGEALDYVAGYTIGLDMTLRGPEERSFRKSIDTYTVLGPWMVTADEFGSPTDVALELLVGEEVRQRANTRDLVLSVAELIEYASSFYTLHPGDVIMTGTPEGVGPVAPGDVMTASVTGIGTIEVAVA